VLAGDLFPPLAGTDCSLEIPSRREVGCIYHQTG
jgi:hypothetical protein